MAVFGKVVTLTLLAHAMALPKIQHRADGPSGFDISQYFNSEKFQEYLKENPSALDYFNLQGQSTSNNAIQSDAMEDAQSQSQSQSQSQYQLPDYQDWMKKCMSSQTSFIPTQTSSSSSSSSSSSAAGTGTKAENNAMPWEQFSSYYEPYSSQFQSYEKCRKQMESYYSQYSPPNSFPSYNNFQPSNFQPSSFQSSSFQPSSFQPSQAFQPPQGILPSSSSSSSSSS